MTVQLIDISIEPMDADRWRRLACTSDILRPNLVNPHGECAADGYRAHLVKDGSTCDCGTESCKAIKDLCEKQAESAKVLFTVNRSFLLDALAGLDESDVLNFYGGGPKDPIVITCGDSRMAIVMPMVGFTEHPSDVLKDSKHDRKA